MLLSAIQLNGHISEAAVVGGTQFLSSTRVPPMHLNPMTAAGPGWPVATPNHVVVQLLGTIKADTGVEAAMSTAFR